MAGIRIEGSVSGNVAEVDTGNNLKTVLPGTLSQVGFAALAGRNDDGVTIGTPRVKRVYATESGEGLKTSEPLMLWDDTFNATAHNTSKYNFNSTTQTGTQAAGFLNLNASAITTINTNSGIATQKAFPLFGKAELRGTICLQLTQVPQANNLIEFGFINAVLSTRVAPLDGIFFRYNASAELRGVINYNGTETQTAAITAPSANVTHDYLIVVTTDLVCFYIDGVLKAVLTLLTDAPAQGQPTMSAALPLMIRTYHGGSAPALATIVRVTDLFVTILGPNMSGRTWAETKCGYGHMAYQGQNGGTMGTSANALNAATPAAAALTNTATSTGSPAGLGGLAHVLPTLAVGTDGILFSFQNPAGSVSQTPRNLIIRGVRISGGVDLALSAAAVLVLAFSLAYGHTAVSLATAESASFATGGVTKAPRRIWLGVLSSIIAAAAGTPLNGGPLDVKFDSPVVVAPGEFVAIAMRNQGVVTATGSIIVVCNFDAYYE